VSCLQFAQPSYPSAGHCGTAAPAACREGRSLAAAPTAPFLGVVFHLLFIGVFHLLSTGVQPVLRPAAVPYLTLHALCIRVDFYCTCFYCTCLSSSCFTTKCTRPQVSTSHAAAPTPPASCLTISISS
jgi:hypothetical protein